MEQNIVYDIGELKRKLEQDLNDLSYIRRNDKYAALLGQSFVDSIAKWEDSIRRQKDMPFTMVVCGEFKRGKSSLINALLGEDVVTTDVTTETITLNKISYGEHSNALVLEDGRRMLLSDEQLCRDQLENVLSQFNGGAYQLEMKRPIEILRKLTIIDTPGLDDALEDFSPMVAEALVQADAVAYVFSVSYPLSLQEQFYLKSSILPQKYTDLFMVGNYTDLLKNESEYQRLEKEIEKRIDSLLSGQQVYMVSALDERCRQIGEERPNAEMKQCLEESFARLREKVFRLVEEKRDMVLPDRMERMMRGMETEVSAYLDNLEHGLQLDAQAMVDEQNSAREQQSELGSRQNEVLQQISCRKKEMCAEAQEWLLEMVARMRQEAQSLEKYELDDVRKYYPIYCIDTLQEGMNRCVDYHINQFYEQLDEISSEVNQKVFLHVSPDSVQSFRFAMRNKTWTKGDNVAFVLDQVGVGSSLVGSFVKVFTGSMRQKEMEKNKDQIYMDIQEQFCQVERSIPAAVERAYGQIFDRVNAQLQEYFNDQATMVETRMEQILHAANSDVKEKEQITQAISSIRNTLKKIVK